MMKLQLPKNLSIKTKAWNCEEVITRLQIVKAGKIIDDFMQIQVLYLQDTLPEIKRHIS
jgi:hypothetical protein